MSAAHHFVFMYYLQRGRYAEAIKSHESLPGAKERQSIVNSLIETLPAQDKVALGLAKPIVGVDEQETRGESLREPSPVAKSEHVWDAQAVPTASRRRSPSPVQTRVTKTRSPSPTKKAIQSPIPALASNEEIETIEILDDTEEDEMENRENVGLDVESDEDMDYDVVSDHPNLEPVYDEEDEGGDELESEASSESDSKAPSVHDESAAEMEMSLDQENVSHSGKISPILKPVDFSMDLDDSESYMMDSFVRKASPGLPQPAETPKVVSSSSMFPMPPPASTPTKPQKEILQDVTPTTTKVITPSIKNISPFHQAHAFAAASSSNNAYPNDSDLPLTLEPLRTLRKKTLGTPPASKQHAFDKVQSPVFKIPAVRPPRNPHSLRNLPSRASENSFSASGQPLSQPQVETRRGRPALSRPPASPLKADASFTMKTAGPVQERKLRTPVKSTKSKLQAQLDSPEPLLMSASRRLRQTPARLARRDESMTDEPEIEVPIAKKSLNPAPAKKPNQFTPLRTTSAANPLRGSGDMDTPAAASLLKGGNIRITRQMAKKLSPE